VDKQASEQSSKAEQVGGTDNEQWLITKALGRVTGTTRLKMRVENPAASSLSESSDKALGTKHAYWAMLKTELAINKPKEVKLGG